MKVTKEGFRAIAPDSMQLCVDGCDMIHWFPTKPLLNFDDCGWRLEGEIYDPPSS